MAMKRRDFLKVSVGASGGLVVSLALPGCAGIQTGYQPETGEWRPDAWLELTTDDQVYFTLARVEMGQGTYTGLTPLIAEELGVAPASIKPRFAPAAPEYRNPLYNLQLTGGSTSLASGTALISLTNFTSKGRADPTGQSLVECKCADSGNK